MDASSSVSWWELCSSDGMGSEAVARAIRRRGVGAAVAAAGTPRPFGNDKLSPPPGGAARRAAARRPTPVLREETWEEDSEDATRAFMAGN